LKILRLPVTHCDKSNIEVVNLISNDATRIEQMVLFIAYLVITPFQTVAIIVILIEKVNYTILGGLILLGLVTLFQMFMNKVYNTFK
jgi:hypothetical protein